MHLRPPPFVPRVRREDSTKYFDSEEKILGDSSIAESSLDITHGVDGNQSASKTKKLLKQKRPRDKLLRDMEIADTVLQARKKGAFLGYTYRRPHTSPWTTIQV